MYCPDLIQLFQCKIGHLKGGKDINAEEAQFSDDEERVEEEQKIADDSTCLSEEALNSMHVMDQYDMAKELIDKFKDRM